MRFSIFISILQSPKTGLNPQIVENKEIHRNQYKNHRVKLVWVFGLLHVASFIDHKII